jgi:hypothetical protein
MPLFRDKTIVLECKDAASHQKKKQVRIESIKILTQEGVAEDDRSRTDDD